MQAEKREKSAHYFSPLDDWAHVIGALDFVVSFHFLLRRHQYQQMKSKLLKSEEKHQLLMYAHSLRGFLTIDLQVNVQADVLYFYIYYN